MQASQSAAFRHQPDPAAREWLDLSFPVTWAFLSEPLSQQTPPQAVQAAAPSPATGLMEQRPGPVVVASVAVTAPEVEPPRDEPRSQIPATPSHDVWEMVVPKMSRPAARSSAVGSKPPVAKPVVAVEEVRQPEREISLPSSWDAVVPASRKIPIPVLAAIGAVVMGGIVFYAGGTAIIGGPPPVKVEPSVQVGPLLPVGLGGWTVVSEWPRRISLLRGSTDLSDFRMEFEGAIETKALGWVFRASDAKNFYAMKLERVTPGRNPVVVLKRFAVVNGLERDVVQVPLPSTVRLDTIYKIRLDVVGDQFTTWVSGHKVEVWTDLAFRKGSIGLLNEREERGTISGDVRVYHLSK